MVFPFEVCGVEKPSQGHHKLERVLFYFILSLGDCKEWSTPEGSEEWKQGCWYIERTHRVQVWGIAVG